MKGRIQRGRPCVGVRGGREGCPCPREGGAAFLEFLSRSVMRDDASVGEELEVLCSGRHGDLCRRAEFREGVGRSHVQGPRGMSVMKEGKGPSG